MSLVQFRCSGFRCLQPAEIAPHPRFNLVTGPNASGKTSLLEALFYLGRGRSFRVTNNRELVQTGQPAFQLFGECHKAGAKRHRIGIEAGLGQRTVRVDGEPGTGADLVRLLPAQAIDPEIHELVQGPPEHRRRLLDWGVFHVKHDFLEHWRRYQRALQQRNAALRAGEPDSRISVWDSELVIAGESVDSQRQAFFNEFMPLFSSISHENLLIEANCIYKRGWSPTVTLAQALHDSLDRDRAMGSTQVGPHRADLALDVQQRKARHRVSRGQQKLLAAALVLAQCQRVAAELSQPMLLVVDDPAAELDRANCERLLQQLLDLPAQLFVTALDAEHLPWSGFGQHYAMEHGTLRALL